jgi:hypothetical protein
VQEILSSLFAASLTEKSKPPRAGSGLGNPATFPGKPYQIIFTRIRPDADLTPISVIRLETFNILTINK